MNGTFETQGSYPFTSAPVGGYTAPNPTGEYVIKSILRDSAERNNFIKLEGDTYSYGFEADATRFSDASKAALAADDLARGVRASNKARQAEAAHA